MDVVLASDVTMLIYKDGDYRPFVCATDLSIDFQMEVKQVRTIGDGKWKKPRGQSLSYTISLSGIITLSGGDPAAFYVIEYMKQMIPVTYRIIYDEVSSGLQKIIDGVALPTSGRLPTGAEGFANCNFEFQGDGEPTIQDTAISCTATIDSASVNQRDEFPPGVVSISFSGASADTERIEYSFDGGGREAFINSGVPNGVIFPVGSYTGEHDLILYPQCLNGEDGTPYLITFTI